MEKVVNESIDERLTKIKIDPVNQLTATSKKELKKIIEANKEIFQADLPGYNHAYGQLEATFEWATKA
jgi:hypothetical protein